MYRVDFNRLRVLVVDDNVHMRRIIKTLLAGFGTRDIFEADEGGKGVELFTTHSPDIVITDWMMPGVDGVEFTRLLRQAPSSVNPYVPILMVTGYTERRTILNARDAGVTEILVKPLSAKALYQRILSIVISPRPFIRTRDYFGPDRRRTTNYGYKGPERRGVAPVEPPPLETVGP